MLRNGILGLILMSMLGCGTSKNVSSFDNKPGFQKLFDGKTTKGWHSYGKTIANTDWKAENGVLHLSPSSSGNGGDLVTDEEYDNFDLKLEWKISPKGNSGILFFINEDPSKYSHTYNTGLEMQVLDNMGHPDAKIQKHRAGDLYDLIACNKETAKAAGEWNQAEIISNNGKIDFILNGINVVSTTLWDDKWRKLVASSKFKTMPGFGIYSLGRIALQDHGDNVWYRKIKIKRL